MSAQISNNKYANIGRMFARQNVPTVYGSQKNNVAVETEETAARVDKVSLSPFAPRPLSAEYLEQAVQAGKTLGEGKKLTSDKAEMIRQDRVFAAVSALALVGHDGSDALPASWPGGIPRPSQEEMEIARRRLAQRPYNMETAGNAEQLQQDRLELLRKTAKRDFSTWGTQTAQPVAGAEARA